MTAREMNQEMTNSAAAALSAEKEVLLQLIEMYREMPYLYNKADLNYFNKTLRDEGYKVLLAIFKNFDKNATITSLKKKIDNLKTTYFRELKKESSLSSNEENENPNCKPGTLKKRKKKKNDLLSKQENIIDRANQLISIKEDPFEVLGKSIGLQLRDLSKKQLTISRKLISDVIYYATLERLNEDSHLVLGSPSFQLTTAHSSGTNFEQSSSASSLYSPKALQSPQSHLQSPLPTQSLDHQLQSPRPTQSPHYQLQSPDPTQYPQHQLQSPHPTQSPQHQLQSPHPTQSPHNKLESPHPTQSPQHLLQSLHTTQSPHHKLESLHTTQSPRQKLRLPHPTKTLHYQLQSPYPTQSPHHQIQSPNPTQSLHQLQSPHPTPSSHHQLQSPNPTQPPHHQLQSPHPTQSPHPQLQSPHSTHSAHYQLELPELPHTTLSQQDHLQSPLYSSFTQYSPSLFPNTTFTSSQEGENSLSILSEGSGEIMKEFLIFQPTKK